MNLGSMVFGKRSIRWKKSYTILKVGMTDTVSRTDPGQKPWVLKTFWSFQFSNPYSGRTVEFSQYSARSEFVEKVEECITTL